MARPTINDRAEQKARAEAQGETSPAKPLEWETIIPLDEATDAIPPFPMSAFPSVVADYVHAVAESVYCPVDYPALAALAAVSSAIGASHVAKIKADFFQGAGLYCAIVGDPSAKKSPPIKHVLRPIQIEQSERVSKCPDDFNEKALELHPHGRGELFVTDVTVEKLGEMLQRQPRGLLLYKPELVGWLLSQNQYKAKGVGADRSFFLEVYDQEPITIHRKGSTAIFVSRPSLTMIGATQPDVVREFFSRRDGLSERILWAFPALLPPRGERWYETPAELTEKWGFVLQNLHALTMRFTGEGKRPNAHILTLSEGEGRAAWQDFTDRLAATMSDPDFPPWMKSTYGKFEGIAARLAMVLQLLDKCSSREGRSRNTDDLLPEWITAAAEMVFYFGKQAQRVQQSCGGDPRVDGAKRIMLWVKDGLRKDFTRAQLWEALRRNPMFRRPEDLSQPLTLLFSHNMIRTAAQDAKATGRAPTPKYEVNTRFFEPSRGP